MCLLLFRFWWWSLVVFILREWFILLRFNNNWWHNRFLYCYWLIISNISFTFLAIFLNLTLININLTLHTILSSIYRSFTQLNLTSIRISSLLRMMMIWIYITLNQRCSIISIIWLLVLS